MLTKLPKKIATACWSGLDLHPFLLHFDSALEKEGYRFREHDIDAACSVWSKEIFQDHALEVSVWPDRSSSASGTYSFEVSLDVSSRRQPIIERLLDIRACYGDDPATEVASDICVLSVSFNWLMARWSPALSSFAEAFNRWRNIKNEDYRQHVDDLIHFYQNQGIAFLEMVGSREKLANTLSHIKSFPGSGAGSGPGSARPREYAAVLYADLGQRSKALRELELGLEESIARPVDQRDAARCVFDRYSEWINKN